jgi:hypothetical protein
MSNSFILYVAKMFIFVGELCYQNALVIGGKIINAQIIWRKMLGAARDDKI